MGKINWNFQDEQGTNLNRYIATNVATGEQFTFDLLRNGQISVVGTPLNADNLNDLIKAINNNYDDTIHYYKYGGARKVDISNLFYSFYRDNQGTDRLGIVTNSTGSGYSNTDYYIGSIFTTSKGNKKMVLHDIKTGINYITNEKADFTSSSDVKYTQDANVEVTKKADDGWWYLPEGGKKGLYNFTFSTLGSNSSLSSDPTYVNVLVYFANDGRDIEHYFYNWAAQAHNTISIHSDGSASFGSSDYERNKIVSITLIKSFE